MRIRRIEFRTPVSSSTTSTVSGPAGYGELITLATQFPAAQLEDVAGNDEVALTAVVPRGWNPPLTLARLAYGIPVGTAPARERVLLIARVSRLLPLLRELRARQVVTVDHVYDY